MKRRLLEVLVRGGNWAENVGEERKGRVRRMGGISEGIRNVEMKWVSK